MRQFSGVFIAPTAIVTGDVVAAEGVNIWYGCIVRGDLAKITLGPRVNLQDGCIVHTDRDAPLVLESGVVARHGAILHGATVGRDSLISMGARLLSRSVVGEGCIIGAVAIVTEDKIIPSRSLVVGVPGRVVRAVTDEEVEQTRAIASRYLQLAGSYAQGHIRFPFGQPGQG